MMNQHNNVGISLKNLTESKRFSYFLKCSVSIVVLSNHSSLGKRDRKA